MKHDTHTITTEQAVDLINQMVNQRGSQRSVAQFLEVSDGYLSDIINGNRGVSDDIARKLGYTRVVIYVKSEDGVYDE